MRSKVITFGTFDLFHIGHLNMLNRCKENGSELIVGVTSDALHFANTSKYPIINETDRMQIIKSLKCVDKVFLEERIDLKREYIEKYSAKIFIIGDDYQSKFDDLNDICNIYYLPRTPNISTTKIKAYLNYLSNPQ